MKAILVILVLVQIQVASAQSPITKRDYSAKYISTGPQIDGNGNDEVWKQVAWSENFIQQNPYENVAPTQKTNFKILYDANNLYALVRAFDTEPSKIDRRITKRDMLEGDLISLQFDSYNDQLTSFVFCVNASEVKTDKLFVNDGIEEDLTWDPIWFVKTSVDSLGWIAEYKIPLSQLRFNKDVNQQWGLQVVRVVFRNQETSLWQFIPRNSSSWVHHYGKLNGIQKINPKRQIEIAPYIVSKLETQKAVPDNPFKKGKDFNIYGGLDGKIGLTNDITFDFTINPDFGQVESDPSEVNLTNWETYFEEKRPFFIEGRNLFDFDTQYGDNLFYSRRIGRAPHGSAGKADYSEIPAETSILGALKLTGKTKNGISLGIIESVTNEEMMYTLTGDTKQKLVAEPYTNFFISRVQKDFSKGNTRIGGMLTSTNRSKNNADHLLLHTAAYTGGIDFNHNWKNKTWYLNFRLIGSRVEGSKQTITQTQLSPLRYYQRPDAPYIHLDSSRTFLMGHGGMFNIGKAGNGHWVYETMLNWHSPGLETNDVGYLQTTDGVSHTAKLVYNQYEPTWIFRNYKIGVNHHLSYNYGLIFNYESTIISTDFLLRNFWNITTVTEINGNFYSNSTMRGGPIIKLPGDITQHLILASDPKKKVSGSIKVLSSFGKYNAFFTGKLISSITIRPNDALDIGITHEYKKARNILQYVVTKEFNGTKKYVFAEVNQLTNCMSVRVNYNITPDLSIQYYGQPFISSVKYNNYKLIVEPKADKLEDRYYTYTGNDLIYDASASNYLIDENSDGLTDYSFEKPDFKSLDFISNLVVRWEFRPGSTVYLVWSQNRKNEAAFDNSIFSENLNEMINIYPVNILMLKFSYRFY